MKLEPIPEMLDGLPNLSGCEEQVAAVTGRPDRIDPGRTLFPLNKIQSAFGVALHMHQSLILQDGDLGTAPVIGTLHIRAWQQPFAAVFGWDALGRVRGFSPPEMHLPNHPDFCYSTFALCGRVGIGGSPSRNIRSRRWTAGVCASGIAAAPGGPQQRGRSGLHHRADKRAWHECGTDGGVVGLNGTEYLKLLEGAGCGDTAFDPIQPIHQHALWQRVGGESTPERVTQAIEEAGKQDHRFHMDGGSWTNNLSWVKGYANVLDPMNRLSALFHQKLDGCDDVDFDSQRYRNALFYLLVPETSCYRCEMCRRGTAALQHEF